MSEQKGDGGAECETGLDFGCFTQAAENRQRALENKYGEASLLMYPTAVVACPEPLDPTPYQMPNRFLHQIYIKYPFLIPKGARREQPSQVLQKRWAGQFENLSTYQEDYDGRGRPEPPALIRASGLTTPDPPKPPNRLPGYPYNPGLRNPLSRHDAIQKGEAARRKEETKSIGKLFKAPRVAPRISEYDDNYNSMVRHWRRIGLYTEHEVFIQHKPTLPIES